MKKKFTYGLLILVIILWGAIFYRLFSDETAVRVPLPVETINKPPVGDSLAAYELIATKAKYQTEYDECPVFGLP